MTFSVIVPAFEAQEFIEECLDSITRQERFRESDDYEILVGVDACPATLAKLEEIGPRYPRLRVFWTAYHKGPYVMRNSLAYKAVGRYLIFFDADDVMLGGLPEWCESHIDAEAAAKFRFRWFWDDGRKPPVDFARGAAGVFGVRRKVFIMDLGGFKAWHCSADTEFHVRLERYAGPAATSSSVLFLYRKHSGCLTVRAKTGAGSIARHVYKHKIQAERMNPKLRIRTDPVVAEISEVKL